MFGRELHLDDGTEVEVISPGVLNTDAGPDFSNARIRIGGILWIGNVEIHVRASDWNRHGHDKDDSYRSVVLHVVAIDDMEICGRDGRVIPQVTAAFPESFFRLYASLCEDINGVRCSRDLPVVSRLVKEDWLETLAVERMHGKAERIINEKNVLGGDWERACFVTLARSLGFGLNSAPFEILARSVPLGYLRRHADTRIQLEAMLFGQAGMLDTSVHIFDEYYQQLCREYYFLARKYGLRPMGGDLWKYARTRPMNFPHRRIALLAAALHGGFSLLSRLISCVHDIDGLRGLLRWELEGYWLTHSDFDRPMPACPSALGEASTDLLLINLAAPVIYAYAADHGDPDMAEAAIDIWRKLRPESNMYVRQWRQLGFECCDAMRSQALLQLRKQYCDNGNCLGCRIGHWLLRSQIRR